MNYDEKKKDTWAKMNLRETTMKKFYEYFGVQEETIEFLGHAVACYFDDDYIQKPAYEAVMKMKLYYESLSMYGKSPYVYPLYGLGELPQVFARVASVYGGTYILRTQVEKILYDEDKKVSGIECKGEFLNGVVKCNTLVGDPSYFFDSDKVVKTGKIIRCICILDHPIPETNNAKGCQIIIPQKQISKERKNGINLTKIRYLYHLYL